MVTGKLTKYNFTIQASSLKLCMALSPLQYQENIVHICNATYKKFFYQCLLKDVTQHPM
jgi:hypothetical protein